VYDELVSSPRLSVPLSRRDIDKLGAVSLADCMFDRKKQKAAPVLRSVTAFALALVITRRSSRYYTSPVKRDLTPRKSRRREPVEFPPPITI
jgi:hypothetical protein